MNQKDFNDLAAHMEAKCGDWKNSQGFSAEGRAKLLAEVEEMDRKAEEQKSQKVRSFRIRKRSVVVLAAVLALLMGTGVAGGRAWIAGSDDLERDQEVTTKVNNEEKDSVLREEEEIYQEIAERLGIATIRLGDIPKGMVLDSYEIAEDTGWAYMNYLYQEKLICVQMFRESIENSSNVQWDGEGYELENIANEFGYEEIIEAYCVDEEHQNYGASITYGNAYYNIFGTFPEEKEFFQILNGIYFK